ncbi:hypothetical protein [Microbulbifer taiwanensis]|uniref:DUF4136 domain-containing protein n=1 Tax=Microbulbifer taiwanensis TaxID=986746 RepID=A0ABW1YL80_9GAMM|nr:hypothetical protein [Microbulbifer taiwanensis]
MILKSRFYILIFLVFSSYSKASECRGITAYSLVNGSDSVVMAYPVELRMTQKDFEADYSRNKNITDMNSRKQDLASAWRSYIESVPYARMKSMVIYKGNVTEGEYFDIFNGPAWEYGYRIGKKYILFLTEISRDTFDVERCVYVDLDKYEVVKDNTVPEDVSMAAILREIAKINNPR